MTLIFNTHTMMKKLLLTLFFLIGCFSVVSAQGHHGKKNDKMFEEIQEFKMKYLAQEMELKDDQKEKFFKLYDEMSCKRFEVMKPAWELERKLKKNSSATEQQYQEAAEAMAKAKDQCAAIEKEYNEKFSQFLSQKQIFKMKEAEDEFRKKMQEMRQNKKGGRR